MRRRPRSYSISSPSRRSFRRQPAKEDSRSCRWRRRWWDWSTAMSRSVNEAKPFPEPESIGWPRWTRAAARRGSARRSCTDRRTLHRRSRTTCPIRCSPTAPKSARWLPRGRRKRRWRRPSRRCSDWRFPRGCEPGCCEPSDPRWAVMNRSDCGYFERQDRLACSLRKRGKRGFFEDQQFKGKTTRWALRWTKNHRSTALLSGLFILVNSICEERDLCWMTYCSRYCVIWMGSTVISILADEDRSSSSTIGNSSNWASGSGEADVEGSLSTTLSSVLSS